jgi:hypothetical protein
VRVLPIRHIRHEIGLAYVAVTGCRQASSHHGPSSAVLLENGISLPGPANAPHDDIRRLGGGRYSFWRSSVYFSTPDNSDPRANGRIYTFMVESGVRWVVLPVHPPVLRAGLGRVVRAVRRRLVTRSLSGEFWRCLYWLSFTAVRLRGALKRLARGLS